MFTDFSYFECLPFKNVDSLIIDFLLLFQIWRDEYLSVKTKEFLTLRLLYIDKLVLSIDIFTFSFVFWTIDNLINHRRMFKNTFTFYFCWRYVFLTWHKILQFLETNSKINYVWLITVFNIWDILLNDVWVQIQTYFNYSYVPWYY